MIKIENIEVVGWEPTIRGMRNPLNSWGKSDSYWGYGSDDMPVYNVGLNDLDLMMRLSRGGPVHAKYRRFIDVYLDITAPLYWWKEFDTYRVGVADNPTDIEMNSCSTMHKIHEKEFVMDDFSHEHLRPYYHNHLQTTLYLLNEIRNDYINYNQEDCSDLRHAISQKDLWLQMIQLLPSSYNQKRTIKLNYEVLAGIWESRRNHKLDEWVEFCKTIEQLQYSEIFTLKG